MNQAIPNGYKRFHEWSGLGHKIKKGSKASWFNGEAFFHKEQTEKTSSYSGSSWEKYEKHCKETNPKPQDDGNDVSDERGSIVGKRGYTQFNSDKWVPVTYYPDGSYNVHCGGLCGDMYVDEFGNA